MTFEPPPNFPSLRQSSFRANCTRYTSLQFNRNIQSVQADSQVKHFPHKQMIQKNICFFNRSNCCQESKKLVEECEEERKSGCKEIFDGNKPLQALSSISGLSTLFPRRCPGCPFSCPPTTPCRVPQKDQHGVRCCKLIGLGRANRVLACPFRCF